MQRKIIAIFLLVGLALPAYATRDIYALTTHEDQQRFIQLTDSLRCLVCQNQNLTESNAPLANDLKQIIAQQIIAQQTNKQIVDYLVTRYGRFILYKPPLTTTTFLLWFMPLIIFILGLVFLYPILRKR